MAIRLPPEFIKTYQDFKKYPQSPEAQVIYGPALKCYRERLKRRKARLFLEDPEALFIPLRSVDKGEDGQFGVSKRNLVGDEKLKAWLGDTYDKDPTTPARVSGTLLPNEDPKCLFIFLVLDSELAPLKLTCNALLRILCYYQVMPQYIDFLLVYGAEEEDRELRFCGFRTRTTFVNPDAGQIIPDLNRSGRRYELCYNLKAVNPKQSSQERFINEVWKIRQYAVYHRFDLGTGCVLWIIADPLEKVNNLIKEVMPDYTAPANLKFDSMPDAFKSSLDTHLVLAQATTEEWRWYIQSLEESVDKLTKLALLYDHDGPYPLRIVPRAVTRVQEYEDKVNEAIMVMESNVNNLNSLANSYSSLVADSQFPGDGLAACKSAVQQFTTHIHELTYDLTMQIARAKVLSKVAGDRKNIVIQQLQIQAALKQEALASSMWEFSEKGQKEAIAMRVVTVITLIYLPPTFVSTLFSTDIIKYQDNGRFSKEALGSFLYVTLPLSFLTTVIAVVFYRRESRKRGRHAHQLIEQYPEVKEHLIDNNN